MKYPISYNNSINSNLEFQLEVKQKYDEASDYLLSFRWCQSITQANLYLNLGSVLCIFLFKIDNIASKDDDKLWVVVGDLPTMYLDTFGPKSTKQVLEDYVNLANDWISHIRSGKSIDDCYPFKSAATIEMANLLDKKITFIKSTVIKNSEDIPIAN